MYCSNLVKLGPSRIHNGFRSFAIVFMAINSALNPIIYMFRCNEFRIAFKKSFRGTSIAPLPTEARAGQSRRQPLFPTIPNEDEKDLTFLIPTSSMIAVQLTGVNLP